MASTMATTAILNPKCINIINTNKNIKPSSITKPISFPPIQTLPKGLSLSLSSKSEQHTSILAGTALAGAIFSTLSSADPAFAAQQIAQIAEGGDNRGIALLLPLIPAIAWVLFNILQPALNQLNRMRETKGIMVGIGLGGLVASGMMAAEASASEIATVAAEAGNDNRGQLLLIVVTPALAWVAYNILQPALNQLNKMRSD
ncbi:Photosystem II core complex proteins psbY chloroplastic [Euphorbia peplus]|nr:Photosystem II core complex proteins psbY chloroplastic [Euphorbia peplus]